MNYFKIITIIFLCFSLLIGCSDAQRQEAIAQSKVIAKDAFNEKKTEPTKKANGISYYLPTDFKVNSEVENNIILTKDKDEYILFVNPNEPTNSKVAYENLKALKNKEANIDSFKKDSEFGYINITPLENRKYELIVGIGGIKMTTKTSAGDMVENTKIMMQIVNSVKYSNEAKKSGGK